MSVKKMERKALKMSRTGENIYKRKDGRWEARYILFYDENGKAKYRYLYAKTYSEVKNKLINDQINNKPQNPMSIKNNLKYENWLDDWLQSKKIVVKESTYIRYKNTIENHIKPELGKYPISKISTPLIEQFVIKKLQYGNLLYKKGLSSKSVSDIMIIIKETFKYAQSYGEKIVCGFNGVALKRSTKEMRVLSKTEEQRLFSVINKDMDRFKLGVFICLCTGIRIGELCALKCKNISLTDKTLKIEETMQRLQSENENTETKTQIIISGPKSFSSLRTIPLPDFLIEKIIPFMSEPNSYILSGKQNIVVEPRTMQNHFKAYLNEGNINDANFHSLRHTFATRCVEVGFDVKTLSEILGHSSVKITLDKYVHSSMQLKRTSMEKLKFIAI